MKGAVEIMSVLKTSLLVPVIFSLATIGNGFLVQEDETKKINQAIPFSQQSSTVDSAIVYKHLYLTDDNQSLDRIDPVATNDLSIATAPLSGFINIDDNVLDEFSHRVFNGNNGSQNYATNWQEIGEFDGPISGGVWVENSASCASGNCLRFGGFNMNLNGYGVKRTADLTGAISANLNFQSFRNAVGGGNASINLDISNDGGITWTTLKTYPMNISDPFQVSESFDILNYISDNTQIRFIASGATHLFSDWIYFDNIEIAYQTIAGTNAVNFTQSPTLCDELTIETSNPINVYTYVNVLSDTLPLNPDINATISYGGNNVITLSNPSFDPAARVVTWSQSLSTPITVPAGQAIEVEITTTDTNLDFEIQYDSKSRPSKIELPVSTYIQINSFEIYDAPYPNGNIIASAADGTSWYLRAEVTDPFGFDDITSLTFDYSNIIYNGFPVDSFGCNKIFEFEGITPDTSGTLEIIATAFEGFEGIVECAMSSFIDICSPPITIPVFASGMPTVRCQATEILSFPASSDFSTDIKYGLDAISLAAGNTIDLNSGDITFVSTFSGTSIITATAFGCGGPIENTHTIVTTPDVTTPVFAFGQSAERCQGANTANYPATSNYESSISYALDNISLAAGNTIDPLIGTVTFDANWSGISTVTAIAEGCNGPASSDLSIMTNVTVIAPTFLLGSSSMHCYETSMTYEATSPNASSIIYTLDAASEAAGVTIDSLTGNVIFITSFLDPITIIATAEGCNGPAISTHTVTLSNNCPPIAADDYITINVGESAFKDVLDNDFDINSDIDPSTLTIIQQPINGTVTVANDEIIYSPIGNFVGSDDFIYEICDLQGNCDQATVFIIVEENLLDPCVQANQMQEFYLPFPEEQLYHAFRDASCGGNAQHSSEVRSVIAIKTPYPTIYIKYDHWEDGYEADLSFPVQASTEIWGDGNLTNGIAPGYPDDVLLAGSSIILDNTFDYTPPRDLSNIVFDGKDKIVSSSDITISKITGDEEVFLFQTAKTSIYDTDRFGTSFTIPFGEDLGQEFQYTALFIRAMKDSTIVTVDVSGDGVLDANDEYAVLNEGEVLFVEGDPNNVNQINDVKSGALVTASEKVGLDILFGGLDCYGTRNINVQPAALYSNTYYTPVPTMSSDAPARVYFYNEYEYDLTIHWTSNSNNGSFTIPANAPSSAVLPDVETAYKFENLGGESFIAMEVIDSDSDGAAYDWAFALTGAEQLSDFTSIAWAPGSADGSRNDGPIWVTPTANTNLFVKLDGDVTSGGPNVAPCGRSYDFIQPINEFEAYRILDNSDNDQSGIALFTCDSVTFFSVYGEDPSTALIGAPSMDVGTTMEPLCSDRLILANEDVHSTPVATPIDIPVLDNDGSFLATIDPNKLYTTGLLQPLNGTHMIDPVTHRIIYTPNPGWEGIEYFEYQICALEDDLLCDVALVTIIVGECNANSITVVASGFTYYESFPDNGAYDGESTIPNIDVSLYWDENGNGEIDMPEDTLILETTSNISGYYEFNFRLLGDFVIEVDENNGGFAPGTLSTASVSFSSLNSCENDLYLGLSPIVDPQDDLFFTFLDTDISANLIANDIGDINPGSITNTSWLPSNGNVTFNTNGSMDYNPNMGFIGMDSFSYQICSNFDSNLCDTATIYVDVICPNVSGTNLITGNVFYDFNEDGIYDGGDTGQGFANVLLYIDSNSNGIFDPADIFESSTLSNADGSYSFTTTPVDHVLVLDRTSVPGTFMTTDNLEHVHFSTVGQGDCINNFGIKDCLGTCPPEASDDVATTEVAQSVIIDVLTNDYDSDGDIDPTSVAIPGNSPTPNGTLFINSINGSIVYNPSPAFNGQDSFYYQVCDQSIPTVLCDTAVVYVYVECAVSQNNNLITGFVYDDVNGDGTFDITENGGDNIQVLLHEDVNHNGIVDGGDVAIDSINSDADGFYQFALPTISQPQTFTQEINNGADDAEEYLSTGNVLLGGNILGLGHDGGDLQRVGLRFNNINIPNNSNITNVYLEFYARGISNNSCNLSVQCEAVDNSVAFSSNNYDVTSRNETNAVIAWNNVQPWSDNNWYQSPNLSSIVQEVLSRPGWNQGNSISFLVEGNPGNRRAESFESGGGPAPRLVIEYEENLSNNADFILNIDENTLPIGTEMTTDNIEFASFNSITLSDCGNNFGFRSCPGGCQPVAVDDIAFTELSTSVVIDVLANDYDANLDIDPTTVAIPLNSPTPNGTISIDPINGAITYTPFAIFSGLDSFDYVVCDQSIPNIKCDTATVYVTVECLLVPNQNVITGYVFEDHNANGSYQNNENGLKNADVVLYEDTNQNGVLDNGDIPIDTTNSDVNGFYQFSMPITNPPQTVSRDISGGEDDAEESLISGNVLVGGNDLGLGHDGDLQLVGLRFNNIDIPSNSNILNVYLEFYADGFSGGTANFTVHCEAIDNSIEFSNINYDITSRPKTNNSVAWNNIPAWFDNNFYQTPDLSPIVQEVIARPGWNQGNNISFLIEGGPARRRAETFESWTGPEARMVIEYEEISGTHFITSIDLNSIPPEAILTTANESAIEFSGTISSDCGNNFGLNFLHLNPVAVGDINATEFNNSVNGNVLINDQGDRGFDINTQVFNLEGGDVVITSNGDYTFIPSLDYLGEASFEYEICDAVYPLLCDTAKVTIDIVECLPDNESNQVIGLEDHFIHENIFSLSADLLANDHDLQGNTLLINTTPISQPSKGNVNIHSDGTFIYEPFQNSTEADEFIYEVCNDATSQVCDTVTVTIHLFNSNGKPKMFATDDHYLAEMEDTIYGNIILNDNLSNIPNFDVDIIPLTAPENGLLDLSSNGTFEYLPQNGFIGNDRFVYKICDTNTPSSCDSATVYLTILDNRVHLDFKVMLQGALYGTTDSLMRADLVDQNLVPLIQPYSTSFNPLFSNRLTHVTGGDEITSTAVLQAHTGDRDAIVDWVFIELRDATDTVTIVETISALLQRDGDIVDAESGGNLYVKDLIGKFFVCIKHRNHLGVMTASPLAVNGKTASADFTSMVQNDLFHFDGYDGLEQSSYNGLNALWAGNANADSKVKYDGTLNDRIILVGEIITAPGNVDSNLNYNNAIGYYQGDINLDGKTKYDGILNDRIGIQNVILTYPNNTSLLNNYNLLIEQVK